MNEEDRRYLRELIKEHEDIRRIREELGDKAIQILKDGVDVSKNSEKASLLNSCCLATSALLMTFIDDVQFEGALNLLRIERAKKREELGIRE